MNKGSLTISRPSYGGDKKKILIQVRDVDAGIRFLDIEIDYADFAACLTGLSEQSCEFEARGLQNVGKRVERDKIEFEVYNPYYKKDDPELIALAKVATPEGWTCSTYFGSQDSFIKKDDKYYARTSISRWVEKEK